MTKKPRVLISFDYALKRLLRNKANYDVLEGFLSELLMQDVKVRSIVESESDQENRYDKQNRVDIMVESSEGELIIVELQIEVELDYRMRMAYGTGRTTSEYMTVNPGFCNHVYVLLLVYSILQYS